MTFADARKILNGGDTAATNFFKAKTHDKLYASFKPFISTNMNEVGTTKAYKEMMGKCESVPFMSKESFDLAKREYSIRGVLNRKGQDENQATD